MRIIATMPIRNEDWALGVSTRVALTWCDELVVLNHASTDRSLDIIGDVSREHPGRVILINETDATWHEMTHRQRMLDTARMRGASHVAIVDADEILTGNLIGSIRAHIEALPAHRIMQLPGYNLRGGIDRYHANGIWGHRKFSVVFCDRPELTWRGDRFHHREPMGAVLSPYMPIPHGSGGVMHLWGASERRLRAKHFAYCLTERMRWPEKPVSDIRRLYSLAVHGSADEPASTWHYRDVPAEWWEPYSGIMHHLHIDAEPWQEQYCRAAVAVQPQLADGLDTFGVI